MQVLLQIVAFSLQIIGYDRPLLTKGKRPQCPPIKDEDASAFLKKILCKERSNQRSLASILLDFCHLR